MVKKVLYAEGSLVLCSRATQQLEVTSQLEVSKFGMMLQRNIFKRITGAGLSDQCQRLYAGHLWAEQPNEGGQTRGLYSEPWEILL